MNGVRLEPVDTLFFRGGTPFTSCSAPQEDVASLFPPHPMTVTGALRAALARCNGWNRGLQWPGELNAVLGDGPDDLGKLSFDGPFLLRCCQPLFRAPRHLLGSTNDNRWIPRLLLRPGSDRTTCDLGDVRLPEPARQTDRIEECKTGDGWWLTLAGMETVLRGEVPGTGEVVSSRSLWREEPRIGLKRDQKKRTAEEGMLYSTRHVRPGRGVSLGVRIGGIPQNWTLPTDQLLPLGGESRLAACLEWERARFPRVPLAEIEDNQVTIIALTPLDLDEAVASGRESLDTSGIRVVSACLDRPQRIGGWDSLNRRPLPLRSVLPPGSVLFCEITSRKRFQAAFGVDCGMPRIGRRQAWGFGCVALGVWPQPGGDNA